MRRQAVFCLLARCPSVPVDAMLVFSSMQAAAAGALWQRMVCSQLVRRPPVAVIGLFSAMHSVVPSSDVQQLRHRCSTPFNPHLMPTTADCAVLKRSHQSAPSPCVVQGAKCSAQGQSCCRMPLLFSKHAPSSQSCVWLQAQCSLCHSSCQADSCLQAYPQVYACSLCSGWPQPHRAQ